MQYLSLILFVALCGLGIFRPVWAMTLLLVMFAIEVALQGSVGLFRSYSFLANVIVACVVGISTLFTLVRQPRPFVGYFTSSYVITLVLLTYSFVSLAWSPAQALSPDQGINIITTGLPYFVVFVLMAPLLIGSIADWKRVTLLMLFVGSLVSLSIVFNPEFTVRSGRISTTFDGAHRTSPLSIAQVGGTIAIFGALSTGGRASSVLSAFRLGGFVFGALLALFSGTRGQVIFALIVIALLFPMSRRLKHVGSYLSLVVGASVIAVAGYFAFEYAASQSDIDRWGGGKIASATAVRAANVTELLEAFAQSGSAWVVGLGYNAFSAVAGADQEYVHNVYVEVLCELGVPMFLLFVALFAKTGASALALFRRYRDMPAERSAVTILIGMWLFQAMIGAKESNLWSAWLLFLYMLIITRLETRARLLDDTAALEEEVWCDDAEHEAGDEGHAEEEPRWAIGQPA